MWRFALCAVSGVCRVVRSSNGRLEDLRRSRRWSDQNQTSFLACVFQSCSFSSHIKNPQTLVDVEPQAKDLVDSHMTLLEDRVDSHMTPSEDQVDSHMTPSEDLPNDVTTSNWGGTGQDAYLERNKELDSIPPSEQKSVRVAIVGIPNAGKSTIINHLVQEKVLAVSPKVHTTSRMAIGVVILGNTQMVLIDTPGVIPYDYAHRLGMSREFMADPGRSVAEADLVLVMADAANKFKREKLDPSIVKILRKNPKVKSVLVLNKVDIIKNKFVLLNLIGSITGTPASATGRIGREDEIGYLVRRLKDSRTSKDVKKDLKQKLIAIKSEIAKEKEEQETLKEDADSEKTESFTEWPHFDEFFMVSALHGDGLSKLQDYIISSAKLREWEYDVSMVTDQPALNLVEDIIREKLCCHFDKELPYVVKQENFIWERDANNKLTIYQYLYCGKKTRMSILIGTNGEKIKTVRDEACMDIEKLFQCPVDLVLHVKA